MTDQTPSERDRTLAMNAQRAAIALISAAIDSPGSTAFPGSTFEQVHHAMLLAYIAESDAPILESVGLLTAALAGFTAGALTHWKGDPAAATRTMNAIALELEVNGPDTPPGSTF